MILKTVTTFYKTKKKLSEKNDIQVFVNLFIVWLDFLTSCIGQSENVVSLHYADFLKVDIFHYKI